MTLSSRDKKYIWHPLTQHKLQPDTIAVVKAEGAVLYDENHCAYIDGIASWYTCMYGHCNEYMVKRVQEQMRCLHHVVFSGFTHEPAVKLSEALLPVLPENQKKLFFSDNGSTAVEVAVKIALQYYFNRGEKRHRIIAFEKGFHGDTFGAMSVSGLSVYNGPFEDFFLNVTRIPVPLKQNSEEVLKLFKEQLSTGEVAAFIYEPLVQGAAGMKMYDPQTLDVILSLCSDYGVLCIADEVMTGFGKTGKTFASDYLKNKPDMLCMSKSLTGGMGPMAITSCTGAIYRAFYDEDSGKGFFHGHTYTANPVLCTAALAGIELLQSDEIQEHIARIIGSHKRFAEDIKGHPAIAEIRQLGTIFALDLKTKAVDRYGAFRDKLYRFFMKNGIFLRPLGNTIYIVAPYIITDKQLKKIYSVIQRALESSEYFEGMSSKKAPK